MAAPTIPDLIALAARLRACRGDQLLELMLIMPSGKTLGDTTREELLEISTGYSNLRREIEAAQKRLAKETEG